MSDQPWAAIPCSARHRVRTRRRAWGVLVVAAILGSIAPSAPCIAQQATPARATPKIAEDRSLTVGQYAAKGIPDTSRPWAPADYKKAHEVLAAIAQDDPRRLPRRGSARSGTVFARIAAPENLAGIEDKNAAPRQRHALFTGFGALVDITGLYVKASTEETGAFDSELVDLYAMALRLHLAGARWSEDFIATIPENDPTRARRLEALSGMRAAGARWIREVFQAFQSSVFRTSELLRLAESLRTLVPQYMTYLPAASVDAITTDVAALEAAETDRDLKTALRGLLDAAKGAKPAASVQD